MLNILINMQPNILRSTTTLFFIIGVLPRGRISKISFNYTFNRGYQIDKCPNFSKLSSLVGGEMEMVEMLGVMVLMVLRVAMLLFEYLNFSLCE